jgi:hypothetical protein
VAKKNKKPVWAPRVPRYKIAHLYHMDAMGIRDDELIDEVGYGLLCRIKSCLTVTEAVHGRVTCPCCENVIVRKYGPRDRRNDELIKCSCGWEMIWSEYHKTYHKKHLQSTGLKKIFKDFVEQFEGARNYQEKMILIDVLLHVFHWQLEGESGGPGAVNLIGGTRSEILAFLNELNYGEQSTEGLNETKKQWLAELDKKEVDLKEVMKKFRWAGMKRARERLHRRDAKDAEKKS